MKLEIDKKDMVQIHHEISDEKWTYQDTELFEKGKEPSDKELETKYQEKFTAWKAYCETPIIKK